MAIPYQTGKCWSLSMSPSAVLLGGPNLTLILVTVGAPVFVETAGGTSKYFPCHKVWYHVLSVQFLETADFVSQMAPLNILGGSYDNEVLTNEFGH